jgi:hypothetical protein
MKTPTATVSFTIEDAGGESQFRETFRNSHEALSYLSGYLGAATARISDFTVDFDWDATTLEA